MDKKRLLILFRRTRTHNQIAKAFEVVNCPKQRRALIDKTSRQAINAFVDQHNIDNEATAIALFEDGVMAFEWIRTENGGPFWSKVLKGEYPL